MRRQPGSRERPPEPTSRRIRRWAIAVGGFALVLGGVILLPLPGPGLAVILAGLSLLATEFRWAQAGLRWARATARNAARRFRSRRRERASHPHDEDA